MYSTIIEIIKTYKKENYENKQGTYMIIRLLKFYTIYIINIDFSTKTIYCGNTSSKKSKEYSSNMNNNCPISYGTIDVSREFALLKSWKNDDFNDEKLNTEEKDLIKHIHNNSDSDSSDSKKINSRSIHFSGNAYVVELDADKYAVMGMSNDIEIITDNPSFDDGNIIQIKFSVGMISSIKIIDKLILLKNINKYFIENIVIGHIIKKETGKKVENILNKSRFDDGCNFKIIEVEKDKYQMSFVFNYNKLSYNEVKQIQIFFKSGSLKDFRIVIYDCSKNND